MKISLFSIIATLLATCSHRRFGGYTPAKLLLKHKIILKDILSGGTRVNPE